MKAISCWLVTASLVLLGFFSIYSCGIEGLECGEGTIKSGGKCVRATPPCEEGTHEVEGVCVPDVLCGEGTHVVEGACIPDVLCGEGTHAEGGECIPDIECGLGTHPEGGECVPDELICGEGTRIEDGTCVWDTGIATTTPWETDIPVSTDTDSWRAESSIGVDSLGNSYVAWIDIDPWSQMSWLKVAVLRAGGTTFEHLQTVDPEPTRPGETFFQGDPTVIVDQEDRVYVGWIDYYIGGGGYEIFGDVVVSYSEDLGETWSTAVKVNVDDGTVFNDRPWMSVSETSEVYITYLALENWRDMSEKVARSTDNGRSYEQLPDFSLLTQNYEQLLAYYAPLVPAATGDLLIPGMGLSQETGEQFLFIARAPSAGSAFSIDRLSVPLYASRDLQWGVRPIIVDAGNGTMFMSYIDAPDGRMGVYLMRSDDWGESFSDPQLVSGEQAGNPTLVWADVDDAGEVHLVWIDNREGAWRVLHRATTPDGTEGQPGLTPLYSVSDVTFSGTTGPGGLWLGDFIGVVARGGMVYATWTDTRDGYSNIYCSRAQP